MVVVLSGLARVMVTGVPSAGAPAAKVSVPVSVTAVPGVDVDGPVRVTAVLVTSGESKTCRLNGPPDSPETAYSVEPSDENASPLAASPPMAARTLISVPSGLYTSTGYVDPVAIVPSLATATAMGL